MAIADRSDRAAPAMDAAGVVDLGSFVRSDVTANPLASLIFFSVIGLAGGLTLILNAPLGWRVVGVLLVAGAAGMIAVGGWALRHPLSISYCFEHGLVVWRRSTGAVAAYPFAGLVGYERVDAGEKYRVLRLQVRTVDGTRVFDYAGDRVADIADRISEQELPRARQRLAAGETVAYGRYRISLESLSWDGVTVPWSEVVEVRPGDEVTARVFVRNRRRPYQIEGSGLPHRATLARLITELGGKSTVDS